MRITRLLPVFALVCFVSDAVSAPQLRPVLITIDDLPIASGSLHSEQVDRERITTGLLAALRKHGIEAVGLVTWEKVAQDSDFRLLEKWLSDGHELGNHSYAHPDYAKTAQEPYIADLEKAWAGLMAFLEPRGRSLRFFRFPFLCEGETEAKLTAMREYLARTGQRSLPVTIDNQDWSFEEPWVTAVRAGDRKALDEIRDDYLAALRLAFRHHEERGDDLFGRQLPQILLLHSNEVGASLWDDLFTSLEQTGHRFATADEVLADPAFSEKCEFVAPFGCGLWDRIRQAHKEDQAKADVAALLKAQAEAWSAGDLAKFCEVYADDAVFVSPSGVTRGRQEVLDRYRRRYPDARAMGKLRLDIIEMRPAWGIEVTPLLDAVPSRIHALSVVARWTLSYPDKDPATGLTLLVLQRPAGTWKIVQDASM
ncbi:MAG: SgcJ/EcaC family oxidoreductase [Acidobacteria bacterium]|nr:SgcJ/EcaC family oxidoreductase [Acidobacteriota bacterium]